MTNNIVIDTDGVLRDFVTTAIAYIRKEYPTIAKDFQITSYSMETDLGVTKEEFFEVVYKKYCREIFTEAKPYEGAADFLEELKGMGFVVYLASSQPTFDAIQYTLDWYKLNKIDGLDISFLRNKSDINCMFLIDDSPSQLEKALIANKKTNNPRRIIQFSHPWNKNFYSKLDANAVYLSNLFTAVGETPKQKYNSILEYIKDEYDWLLSV